MTAALAIVGVLLLAALVRDVYYRPRRRSSEAFPRVHAAPQPRGLGDREGLAGSPDRSTRRTREQKDELASRALLYPARGALPPGPEPVPDSIRRRYRVPSHQREQ